MPDINLLASGGIAAAVIAGWSQVKAAFSYVSSSVMVTAQLDSPTRHHLIMYLRYSGWHLVPGGKLFYSSSYLGMRDGGYACVPFRLPPSKAIYYKAGKLLFVNLPDRGSGSITFVRGTLNPNKLIAAAFDFAFAQEAKHDASSKISRYSVVRVSGREKSYNAPVGSVSDSLSGPSSESASSNSASPALFTAFDKSFMRDSSDWLFTQDHDPLANLYFDSSVLKYLDQATRWYDLRQWHLDRKIPWRRGWLLYGPPGTGKSSLAKATAQKLGIPIYQYNLSTMSDQELMHEWSQMVTPCVALLEDFDNIFCMRENVTDNKLLTFDCILNVISGVEARDGVFLMVTTNHVERIDPAMGVSMQGTSGVSTRPGRIDTAIRIGRMSSQNRRALASRILRDWPEEIERVVTSNPEVTPAQFEEICVQLAYTKLAEAQ